MQPDVESTHQQFRELKIRDHVKRKKIEKKLYLSLFRDCERICGFSSVEFGSCYTWGTDEECDDATLPRKEEITVTQVASWRSPVFQSSGYN